VNNTTPFLFYSLSITLRVISLQSLTKQEQALLSVFKLLSKFRRSDMVTALVTVLSLPVFDHFSASMYVLIKFAG